MKTPPLTLIRICGVYGNDGYEDVDYDDANDDGDRYDYDDLDDYDHYYTKAPVRLGLGRFRGARLEPVSS